MTNDELVSLRDRLDAWGAAGHREFTRTAEVLSQVIDDGAVLSPVEATLWADLARALDLLENQMLTGTSARGGCA